jgi:AhpD family alkylhydroperoxidase
MTEQIKELIALGAAIGANCEPCFKFHYDKASKLGVSTEALREAVGIGETVKQASAKNILDLAARVLGTEEPARRSLQIRRPSRPLKFCIFDACD